MRYGYINEAGFLTDREVTDQEEFYIDDSGERQRRVIPKDEIAKVLSENGWKPVNAIDESKTVSDEEDFYIKVLPYDAGEYIDFRYERRFDRRKYLDHIQQLKAELSDSDYKITKCYEASLLGNEPPYDIVALHSERQASREKINELEQILTQK